MEPSKILYMILATELSRGGIFIQLNPMFDAVVEAYQAGLSAIDIQKVFDEVEKDYGEPIGALFHLPMIEHYLETGEIVFNIE